MPKKDYDTIHRGNVDIYARKIQAVYDSAVKEAASIGSTVPNFDPSKPFSFSDYPITHNRVKKLSNELQSNLEAVVLNGIDHEWTLSNNKNNELCNRVFGDNVGKLTKEQYRRYYSNNGKAADAFKARKVSGLNLSDRVWKYSDQFKTEIEFGIDLDLRDGTSAADMARNLKQYLQNPDKLFRRVRDEHGQLHLSKAAKAFKPGQGVYRSSVKNAQRLARTETNMAYHAADHERWQQLDFVVGVEVRTSNNHPVSDICDTLAGKYPKDFKFTSWHPNCRCYAVPILKTVKELKGDTERIISGKKTFNNSSNSINDVSDGFKDWVENNKERIASWQYTGTIPYFLRDNDKYVHLKDFQASVQQMRIIDSKKEYLSYGAKWRREFFDIGTGGFLVTHTERVSHSRLSKNEQTKFKKESDMSIVFAQNGYKIEMLPEVPRISSPDVMIDGKPADLKRLTSHNNLVKHAKKAVREQGADIVLFQFDKLTPEIHNEINKLIKEGIKGMYFITGENIIYTF